MQAHARCIHLSFNSAGIQWPVLPGIAKANIPRDGSSRRIQPDELQ
jgi:hypothetical protein